eukprot:gene20394-24475_t
MQVVCTKQPRTYNKEYTKFVSARTIPVHLTIERSPILVCKRKVVEAEPREFPPSYCHSLLSTSSSQFRAIVPLDMTDLTARPHLSSAVPQQTTAYNVITKENFTGPACTVPVRFYRNYFGLTFEETKPHCEYTLVGGYENKYSFTPDYTQQNFTYFIKFYSIREIDVTGELVREQMFENMQVVKGHILNDNTPQNFTYAGDLKFGGRATVEMLIAGNDTTAEWLNVTMTMAHHAVKYTLNIEGYQFLAPTNQLQVTWNISTGSIGPCDFKDTRQTVYSGQGEQNFNAFAMPMYSFGLYGRFPTKGIADGRQFNCKEEDKSRTWIIVVAVVVPSVVVISALVGFVFAKRNSLWMRKLRTDKS